MEPGSCQKGWFRSVIIASGKWVPYEKWYLSYRQDEACSKSLQKVQQLTKSCWNWNFNLSAQKALTIEKQMKISGLYKFEDTILVANSVKTYMDLWR